MPRLLSLLVAVVVILTGIITSLPLWREKAVQEKQFLVLNEELRREQARTRELTERINAVKTDPRTVERFAREKFGLARTGETIFKFRSDLPNATAQAPLATPGANTPVPAQAPLPPRSAPPRPAPPANGTRPAR